MTPSGPPGSGGRIPPLGLETDAHRPVSAVSDRPGPPESVPPEGAPASVIPSRLPADRQPILGVFNPFAQGGKIGKELPHFTRTMERAGYRVIPVETVADEAARSEMIFNAARDVLSEVRTNGTRVIVVPYGGDGTIWQTTERVIPATGINLDVDGVDPVAASRELESLLSFFLPKKGTAADNAVQTGSPKYIPWMPRFVRRAITLPFWFPTVETRETPGARRYAGQSYGGGVGGWLFEQRAANFAANPKNPLNRGLISFLRLLPNAVFTRYGMLGFDVHLRHYRGDGTLLQEATRRGSEVIVTPNRIIAGVGGVPGAWGETKIVILPPGLPGVFAIGEYIFRGVGTKLGFNLVGPRSRLRTLSAERQWQVRTGERVEVEMRAPNSLGWDVLRVLRQWNAGFRGLFDVAPEIPAAGELLRVPAQLNGDVAAWTSGFTVRSPGLAVPTLAHPNSPGVRLARASALVDGTTPLIGDERVTSFLKQHHPEILEDTPQALRARTPFLSQPRVMSLLSLAKLPFQRGLELLAGMRSVEGREHLGRLADWEVNPDRAREFLESPEGQAWAAERRGEGRALRERLVSNGAPLLAGIGAMLGAEVLADRLGLDPVRQRELRFGLVVYGSHAVTANFSPLWEVTANRLLGRPYDFIRTRYARAAGEIFAQYTFESQSTYLRALGASWRSGALGIEAGVETALWRRAAGLAGLPIRAAWNMGEGLIFSRIAEQAVRHLPEASPFRRYAPMGAFFLPDLGRLLFPGSARSFFSTRMMRVASRVFAAGFISDMAFTGLHRVAHGTQATYEHSVNFRAAELRRERGDISWYSWRNIPRLVAPSLSAYIDTHEWLFGPPIESVNEVRAEDDRMSLEMREGLRRNIPWVAEALGTTVEGLFREEIRLTETERDMMQQIEACRGRGRLTADAGFEKTAAYLRNQFRGVVRSDEEAARHLARIYGYRLQQQAATLSALEVPGNGFVRGLFDGRGRLNPGREFALAAWLDETPLPGLLAAR